MPEATQPPCSLRQLVQQHLDNAPQGDAYEALHDLAAALQAHVGKDPWTFRPLGKHVTLSRDRAPAKVGAINLTVTDQAERQPNTATVLAIGPGVTAVKVGDRVVFPPFATPPFAVSNDPKQGGVMLVHEDQLLGIVDD